MTLKLFISTCPNDTFSFDALINKRIDTMGLDFEVCLEDIEQLNARLLADPLQADVSKMSYAVLPGIVKDYALLDSGSALGRGNGPVFVSTHPVGEEDFAALSVATPGELTTANMLLQRLFPQITRREGYLFSDVATAIASGKADAGVLIHEGRFTYASLGLHLLCDLGERWERQTGLPLPLGGIVASRRLAPEVRALLEALVRRSIEYGMADRGASREFIRSYAREMDDGIIDRHIDMFVNDYSLSLGEEGRRAVAALTGVEVRR